MSVVLPFPAPPLPFARPGDDAVVVFHAGRALRFDSPAAMRRSVLDAELPEIRAALDALEARAAELAGQAQAAGRAALSLSGELSAERQAHAARLKAERAANAVRLCDTGLACAAAGFALGLILAAALGLG